MRLTENVEWSCSNRSSAILRETSRVVSLLYFFFFQAEDGIRDLTVTGVQTCALPISFPRPSASALPCSRSRTPACGSCTSASTRTRRGAATRRGRRSPASARPRSRSEEHTSELQSQSNLVCRLLLQKKKITTNSHHAC